MSARADSTSDVQVAYALSVAMVDDDRPVNYDRLFPPVEFQHLVAPLRPSIELDPLKAFCESVGVRSEAVGATFLFVERALLLGCYRLAGGERQAEQKASGTGGRSHRWYPRHGSSYTYDRRFIPHEGSLYEGWPSTLGLRCNP